MESNTHSKTMDDVFFEEYTSPDAIRKYTKATAGHGISYLLDHDYLDIYRRALKDGPADLARRGASILEFGCGGGMNLVHLLSALRQDGIPVNHAIGTDFSPVLIEAAQREASTYLPPEARGLVLFRVARNESLLADLQAQPGSEADALAGAFDLIFGVNTFRYCHRGGGEVACARDIKAMLRPGGVCVVIDMNDRFPAFRSAIKGKLTGRSEDPAEAFIPSLDEYAAPFEQNGFEILRKEHFCWVPHSAGRVLSGVMRLASPILDAVAGTRAMRSLVVARKPAERPGAAA